MVVPTGGRGSLGAAHGVKRDKIAAIHCLERIQWQAGPVDGTPVRDQGRPQPFARGLMPGRAPAMVE